MKLIRVKCKDRDEERIWAAGAIRELVKILKNKFPALIFEQGPHDTELTAYFPDPYEEGYKENMKKVDTVIENFNKQTGVTVTWDSGKYLPYWDRNKRMWACPLRVWNADFIKPQYKKKFAKK